MTSKNIALDYISKVKYNAIVKQNIELRQRLAQQNETIQICLNNRIYAIHKLQTKIRALDEKISKYEDIINLQRN